MLLLLYVIGVGVSLLFVRREFKGKEAEENNDKELTFFTIVSFIPFLHLGFVVAYTVQSVGLLLRKLRKFEVESKIAKLTRKYLIGKNN